MHAWNLYHANRLAMARQSIVLRSPFPESPGGSARKLFSKRCRRFETENDPEQSAMDELTFHREIAHLNIIESSLAFEIHIFRSRAFLTEPGSESPGKDESTLGDLFFLQRRIQDHRHSTLILLVLDIFIRGRTI
jgi:hypothetical protein